MYYQRNSHHGCSVADFVSSTQQRVYDQVDRNQVDHVGDVHLERMEHSGTDTHDHSDWAVNVVDPTTNGFIDGRNNCRRRE